MNNGNKEKKYIFDHPENVNRLLKGFYACCALLFALDFIIDRHASDHLHPWEKLWGFYPMYGFVGCVVLVLIAKQMRKFLMRDEHYYDRFENPDMKEVDRDQNNINNNNSTGEHNVDA